MNVLIIDDEKDCCDILFDFVKILPDCIVYKAYSGTEGLSIVKKNKIDIVFSDVDMPDITGIDISHILKSGNYGIHLILISGKEYIINSINLIDKGIYDFLIKPVDIYKIKEIIESISRIKNNINTVNDFSYILNLKDDEIINLSELFNKNQFNIKRGLTLNFSEITSTTNKKLEKLNSYPEIPVLIEGKSGVGKEVAARYLHYKGMDNNKPFIGVNCASINKEIFEAELFGYVKGAFTGADLGGSDGYIKASERGTLFLDEISEIPLNLQAKLLRVLQEGEYYKVGSRIKEKVSSRFVFASNKNLKKLVAKGLFREDLYYRIHVCKILIPSLKERKEEIIPLSIYFINEMIKKMNLQIDKIEAGVFKYFYNHTWKGNIRELQNYITNLIFFCESNVLKTEIIEVSKILIKKELNFINTKDFLIPEKPFDIEDYMQKIVKKALVKFNGNKTKTAEFLNLTRIQMYKRYGGDKKGD